MTDFLSPLVSTAAYFSYFLFYYRGLFFIFSLPLPLPIFHIFSSITAAYFSYFLFHYCCLFFIFSLSLPLQIFHIFSSITAAYFSYFLFHCHCLFFIFSLLLTLYCNCMCNRYIQLARREQTANHTIIISRISLNIRDGFPLSAGLHSCLFFIFSLLLPRPIFYIFSSITAAYFSYFLFYYRCLFFIFSLPLLLPIFHIFSFITPTNFSYFLFYYCCLFFIFSLPLPLPIFHIFSSINAVLQLYV